MAFWLNVHKALNLAARTPGIRALCRNPAARRLRRGVELRMARRLPDRHYFERTIIPRLREAVPQRVPLVGCAPYTAQYAEMMQSAGIELWTLDLAEKNAAYGAPGHHITGDLLDAETWFRDRRFGVILLNGVIGYGLSETPRIARAIGVLRRLLKAEGILLIGWDRALGPDPLQLESCSRRFRHAPAFGLPERRSFDVHPRHVYDWFVAMRSISHGP